MECKYGFLSILMFENFFFVFFLCLWFFSFLSSFIVFLSHFPLFSSPFIFPPSKLHRLMPPPPRCEGGVGWCIFRQIQCKKLCFRTGRLSEDYKKQREKLKALTRRKVTVLRRCFLEFNVAEPKPFLPALALSFTEFRLRLRSRLLVSTTASNSEHNLPFFIKQSYTFW